MLMGSEVKITSKVRCHIGVAIGSEAFKISYTKSIVGDWFKQLKLLTKKDEPESKSIYSAFDGEFKGKLTCFRCTVPSLRNFLKSPEDVIQFNCTNPTVSSSNIGRTHKSHFS